MNKLKIGTLYKDGQVVNHRSISKIILNPILRYFGYYIGSKFTNNKFYGYKICKCKRHNTIKYSLECNEYDEIKMENII